MRYNEEKKLLIVDVKEAVATARRGMSTYTAFDEEEPVFSDLRLPDGYTKENAVMLSRELEVRGLCFKIEGKAFF